MHKTQLSLGPRVFVVEASAGSGKTYELARRYVQLSLSLSLEKQSLPIQSILAVTFTNKAAWEMKERILDFFKRITLKQLKPYEVEDILRPLGLNENEAQPLALGLMNDIIRHYHYFQVATIDSFINVLLVSCSFKIGLSAHFKIQHNAKEYLQLAMDELLQEAHQDRRLRELFEKFLQQYLFLENRLGWFVAQDLLKVMEGLFKQYNTYQKPLVVFSIQGELLAHKRKIHGLIKELKNVLPAGVNKRFRDHVEVFLKETHGVFDVDTLSSYWSRKDVPVNKGGTISDELARLWKNLKTEIHDLCYLEAHSLYNLHGLLFKELLTFFNRRTQRDDVLFLEELNRRAALLFDDHLVTAQELYVRLCVRFRHYLVDEFQDTSMSQWRNLCPLIEEALSCGGTLFYVGDKKQAIYAFRGGESRLFDALQSQLRDFDVHIKNLDKNYRSLPEIINFNNRVFSLENLQGFLERREAQAQEDNRPEVHFSKKDFETIAQTYAHAHQQPVKSTGSGLVRVQYLGYGSKTQRTQQLRQLLLPLLKDLIGRFALKDIAILTRGNEEAETITQWLLEEPLAAKSERSSDIKNNPLITDVVYLLHFLSSPADNNAFAQFCLGSLMPKATGLSCEQLRDFLFECSVLAQQNRLLCFYQHFKARYPEVWDGFFKDFMDQSGLSPLYELTAGIIERFGCIKNFPAFHGFFMHFLELIKKQEQNSCTVSYFLNFYEHLEDEGRFVAMAELDAVQILTIHKAKGLEFPVVIVPFLEMDVKVPSTLLDIQEEGMGLIRMKESYRQFCPSLQERYEQEYKKAFLVELNSVYVATTRAVQELYVFIPPKVGHTVNPAQFLIPSDCLSLGAPQAPDKRIENSDKPTHLRIKPYALGPWKTVREEFLDRPQANALLAHRGELYHTLLKFMGHLQEGHEDEILQGAWDSACHGAPYAGNFKEVLNDIRDFIKRDDVHRFFYLSQDFEVFCEKEFVNALGDTRRVDRLVVSKDEVWVIDFKWSPAEQVKHKKQMEEYVALVKELYPKRKVSGHVLYFQE